MFQKIKCFLGWHNYDYNMKIVCPEGIKTEGHFPIIKEIEYFCDICGHKGEKYSIRVD